MYLRFSGPCRINATPDGKQVWKSPIPVQKWPVQSSFSCQWGTIHEKHGIHVTFFFWFFEDIRHTWREASVKIAYSDAVLCADFKNNPYKHPPVVSEALFMKNMYTCITCLSSLQDIPYTQLWSKS